MQKLRIPPPRFSTFPDLQQSIADISTSTCPSSLQGLNITQYEQTPLRSSQSYIQPSSICQEPNVPTRVVADGTEDDDIFLSSLEPIDCLDFNVRKLHGTMGPQDRLETFLVFNIDCQETVENGDLSDVRSDDTDVATMHVLMTEVNVCDAGSDLAVRTLLCNNKSSTIEHTKWASLILTRLRSFIVSVP